MNEYSKRIPEQQNDVKMVESKEIKVIGAGLGRTGTSSLTLAMQQLGLTPYHMVQGVFETPGKICLKSDLWLNIDSPVLEYLI